MPFSESSSSPSLQRTTHSLAYEPERYREAQQTESLVEKVAAISIQHEPSNISRSDSSYERLEKPRASTPQRLGFVVNDMSDLKHFRRVGSGTHSNVYLDITKEQSLGIKAAKSKTAHKQYTKEIAMDRLIQSSLTSGELDPLLHTLDISREQLSNSLSLCRHSTKSETWSPGQWLASLPPIYDTEELFERYNQMTIGIATDLNSANRSISQENRTKMLNLLSAIRDVMVIVTVLHELNIAHLDIKPENILMDDSGRGYLIDFGFASHFSKPCYREKLAGTLDFVAPEIVMGEKYDYMADIYSAGIMLQEIFLGCTTQRACYSQDQKSIHFVDKPLYEKEIIRGWKNIAESVLGSPNMALLDTLVMPWLRSERSDLIMENFGMTHPNADNRPTALEVTEDLNKICRSLGLNKPLSSEKFPAVSAGNP